jgi:hypothetical protein
MMFCQINRCTPFQGSSHLDFLASVRVQLSAASAAKHAGHLRILLHETKRDPVVTSLNMLLKLYNEEHAKKRVLSSPDFRDTATAIRVVRRVPQRRLRLLLLSMLMIGPRLADIAYLTHGKNVRIDRQNRRVALDIFFSKNRRSTKELFRITLTQADFVDFPAAVWTDFCDLWETQKHATASWAEAAGALRDAADALGVRAIDGREVTPGSLRRQFVHNRIRDCTRDNGTVDLVGVAQKTGHRQPNTIMAYYNVKL